MKKAIVVLTKGYLNNDHYHSLIERNKSIDKNLIDRSIDIIIFHEGNITENQQRHIIKESPDKLNIIFKTFLFNLEKNKIKLEEEKDFKHGYRHMCHFWFCDFIKECVEYDKIIRIDEDVKIMTNIDYCFEQLNKYLFLGAKIIGDCDSVTIGLNDFSLDFFRKNNKNVEKRGVSGIYTNFSGFSLDKIGSNELLKKYQKAVSDSDMIYKKRWGDLPLWGDAIEYIFGNDTMSIDKDIKYYHVNEKINC